jgi:Zn-finger nucleic acid-binding protein
MPGRATGTRARCRCGTTFPIPAEPKVAGTLNCPSCGAGADPNKQSCNYCSASLALSACPSCFGMMFAGTRHCPHCGVRADQAVRPAEAMESVRRCARCPGRPPLVAALVAGIAFDRCEKCGGTFVDTIGVDTLVADRDRQAALHKALDRTDDLTIEPPPAATGMGAVKYLKCPECAVMMNRRNFGRVSGVIIDVCKIHGTWFDADELRRVVEFVQKGGLDKMRKLEINELEREIESRKSRMRVAQSTATLDRNSNWRDDTVAAGLVELAFEAILSIW